MNKVSEKTSQQPQTADAAFDSLPPLSGYNLVLLVYHRTLIDPKNVLVMFLTFLSENFSSQGADNDKLLVVAYIYCLYIYCLYIVLKKESSKKSVIKKNTCKDSSLLPINPRRYLWCI